MYAKAKRSLPEMFSFSVCLWIKSNASPGVGTPFSYAVPGQANELVLIEWGNNPMEILINDKVMEKLILMAKNRWHKFYLCSVSLGLFASPCITQMCRASYSVCKSGTKLSAGVLR